MNFRNATLFLKKIKKNFREVFAALTYTNKCNKMETESNGRRNLKLIFESHAHYDDRAFDEDRDILLGSMPQNGIECILNACSTVDSVTRTLQLMDTYPFVYGALGVHPSEIAELDEERFAWIREQFSHPKAVAVGEIGLDYYWDKEEDVQAKQREWFARHLAMAKELDKPVVIHSRDAAKDTYDVLSACGGNDLRAVVHCFSYTKETAKLYLNWDYYFGIGGVVTFANGKKLKEVVEYIPLERILLETDSPYLSPVPFRGKRNSSLHLPYVAQEIARIKGIDAETVIEVTNRNAKQLFGIR